MLVGVGALGDLGHVVLVGGVTWGKINCVFKLQKMTLGVADGK